MVASSRLNGDAVLLGYERPAEVAGLLPRMKVFQVSPESRTTSDVPDVVNLTGGFIQTLRRFGIGSLSQVKSVLRLGVLTEDGRGNAVSDWSAPGFLDQIVGFSSNVLYEAKPRLRGGGFAEVAIFKDHAYYMVHAMVKAGFAPENVSLRSFGADDYELTASTRLARDNSRPLLWVRGRKGERVENFPNEGEVLKLDRRPKIVVLGDQHTDRWAESNPGLDFTLITMDPGAGANEVPNLKYERKEFIDGLKQVEDGSVSIARSTLAVGLYNREGLGDNRSLHWSRPGFDDEVYEYTTDILNAAYPKIRPGGIVKVALGQDHIPLAIRAMVASNTRPEDIYFRFLRDREYISPGAKSYRDHGEKLMWAIVKKPV